MAKYTPLKEHLMNRQDTAWRTTFAEVERVLRQPLPPSAHNHQAWWANERKGNHVHAHAWMDAGWHVDYINRTQKTVCFRRN